MSEYSVDLIWDPEAAVWVATSEDDDIVTLALESGSADALIERVKYIIPELLELNGIKPKPFIVRFNSQRRDQVRVNSSPN